MALRELWDDITQLPEYLRESANQRGFFWFGPQGTVTPFHHDLTNNFMAQVMGSKRVHIMPACEVAHVYNLRHCFTQVDGMQIDYARFPQMREVQTTQCEIQPGEILFLPVGCWHMVEGLSTSVTMAFTNFIWDNDFFSAYPADHDFLKKAHRKTGRHHEKISKQVTGSGLMLGLLASMLAACGGGAGSVDTLGQPQLLALSVASCPAWSASAIYYQRYVRKLCR